MGLVLFLKVGKRRNGIRGFGKLEFDPGGLQPSVIADGEFDQMKAVIILKQASSRLQGIVRTNNHPYLIEVGEFRHVCSDHHVPVMDGIEGAEKKTGFHRRNRLLRGRQRFILIWNFIGEEGADLFNRFPFGRIEVGVDDNLVETEGVLHFLLGFG